MLSRPWVAGIALGIALTGSALCVQAQVGEGDEQRQASPEQDPSEDSRWTFPVEIIEDEAETDARQRRDERAEQREVEDLLAQQGMDNATQRMAETSDRQTWLIGIGTVLLFVTLLLTLQANRAAVRAAEAGERAVEVTREMGAAQTRAYLVVTGGEVIYDGYGRPTVNITIRNTGQSPAYDVNAVYQLGRKEQFTAAPTGAKGGLKVAQGPMAQLIGGGCEENLTILSVIVTDDTVVDGNSPDFSMEGVIEYKTVFGENSWEIDTRTSFLFHTEVRRRKLAVDLKDGKSSRHPMQMMPAFMSGWVIDYRNTMAAIREGERKANAKAEAKNPEA